jgi:hypothetical protein
MGYVILTAHPLCSSLSVKITFELKEKQDEPAVLSDILFFVRLGYWGTAARPYYRMDDGGGKMSDERKRAARGKITREKLLEMLRKIARFLPCGNLKERFYDTKAAHIEADRLLVEYIDDKDIAEAFDSIGKWYA